MLSMNYNATLLGEYLCDAREWAFFWNEGLWIFWQWRKRQSWGLSRD